MQPCNVTDSLSTPVFFLTDSILYRKKGLSKPALGASCWTKRKCKGGRAGRRKCCTGNKSVAKNCSFLWRTVCFLTHDPTRRCEKHTRWTSWESFLILFHKWWQKDTEGEDQRLCVCPGSFHVIVIERRAKGMTIKSWITWLVHNNTGSWCGKQP